MNRQTIGNFRFRNTVQVLVRRAALIAPMFMCLALFAPQAMAQGPCCQITATNQQTGIFTAKVNATGQLFEFRVTNPALLQSLKVSEAVYANFKTRQVSVDGKTPCGTIVSLGPAKGPITPAAPSTPAAPQPGASPRAAGGSTPQAGPVVPTAGTVSAPPSARQSTTSTETQKGAATTRVKRPGQTLGTSAPACATTSSELFLKLEGVEGESQDPCHPGEIELLSFDMSGSAPQHPIFAVVKRMDRASPRIWMAAFNANPISQATITLLNTSGSQRQLITYVLKNALVTAINVSAAADTREAITFTPGSVQTTQQSTNLTLQASAGPPGVDVLFALPSVSASEAVKPGTRVMRPTMAPAGQAQLPVGNPVFNFAGGFSWPHPGAGQSSPQNFVVTKPIDTDSAALESAYSTGQSVPSAAIAVRRKDGGYSLAFKLFDVRVAAYSQDVVGGTQQEQVSLQPGRIEIDYK